MFNKFRNRLSQLKSTAIIQARFDKILKQSGNSSSGKQSHAGYILMTEEMGFSKYMSVEYKRKDLNGSKDLGSPNK